MKVYAVVIWFNPTYEYVKNLLTYYDHVDGVIVIDNSSSNNADLLTGLTKIEYLCNLENMGVAKALNIGYQHAIRRGADWVLTMDQDSKFEPEHVRKLIKKATIEAVKEKIAIFAPSFQVAKTTPEALECNSVVTSGSMVNLAAHQNVSGYNEELFIDQVDHEYCFRLKKAGYLILRLNDVIMNHIVGEPVSTKFLWVQVSSANHNHIRKYYMTRNRLYMRRNYPEFGAPYLKMIAMDFLKVLLVESEKYLKLKYMFKGAVDYFRSVKGKLR